MRNSALKEH